MSIKSVVSIVSSVGEAILDETNDLSSGASSTGGSPVVSDIHFDSEPKRGEQRAYAQHLRSQVEPRYAQQQNQTQQQDKDKLKPKPGERVVTMRGKKIIRTETVPYPQQRAGTVRPRPGERVVTMTSRGRILRTEVVPQQPVKPTLATYARQADKLIQGAGSDARERNRAITGAYASL
jgi:hypothetical protein